MLSTPPPPTGAPVVRENREKEGEKEGEGERRRGVAGAREFKGLVLLKESLVLM